MLDSKSGREQDEKKMQRREKGKERYVRKVFSTKQVAVNWKAASIILLGE